MRDLGQTFDREVEKYQTSLQQVGDKNISNLQQSADEISVRFHENHKLNCKKINQVFRAIDVLKSLVTGGEEDEGDSELEEAPELEGFPDIDGKKKKKDNEKETEMIEEHDDEAEKQRIKIKRTMKIQIE